MFTEEGVTSRFYRRDGRFYVETEGPDGQPGEFEITHVFGHDPLQQYLIPFAGGRLQTLNVCWDVIENKWFRQYPDRNIAAGDWLHWTRGAQTWNLMCAECHSTNLQKGYDPQTDTYRTTWTDIDVGCEACHGPGSQHVAWAELPPQTRAEASDDGLVVATDGISSAQLVTLCAPCHSRRGELGDYDHTSGDLLDQFVPSLLEEGLYHPDGQILDEVYVYGSFLQSKMYAEGVSCADCHDSHSLKLHHEGNDLCLQCHQPDVYDTPSHHFHKKMVNGRESDGAQCVKCHMVEQPYMVNDWRADHSFRVPRPDLTAAIGVPNACNQCHDDQPVEWAIDAYRKWYGDFRKPHFGTVFAAARRGDPTVQPALLELATNASTAPIVEATALSLLARRPDDDSLAALRAAMKSENSLLRHTAAQHLPITTEADAEQLLHLLGDPVKAVRMAAVSRLGALPRTSLGPDQQQAFDDALGEYREATAHTLDFPASNFNLGNLEYALGNLAAAEHYFRAALRIDDLFSPAKANLAVLLSAGGRNEDAETLLREILRDYPADAAAMYSLGLLLVERGQAEEGLSWLTKAVEVQPDNPRAHYNRGLLLQQLNRLDEAEAALRRALALEPAGLDYLHALADHLIRRGRREEAGALVDRIRRSLEAQ